MAANEPLFNFFGLRECLSVQPSCFVRRYRAERVRKSNQMACYLRHVPGFSHPPFGLVLFCNVSPEKTD